MKNVFALGLSFALVATAYGSASAATYTIHVRNASDAPTEFVIFQRPPDPSPIAGYAPKQFCVPPEESRLAAIDEPPHAKNFRGTNAPTEIEFQFKSSTCEGRVISTQRLEESNPTGTYTITGAHGHYTISH